MVEQISPGLHVGSFFARKEEAILVVACHSYDHEDLYKLKFSLEDLKRHTLQKALQWNKNLKFSFLRGVSKQMFVYFSSISLTSITHDKDVMKAF